MQEFVIVNGQYHNANSAYLNAENRGFLYGDGLFETIRLINGKPLFVSDHFKRLQKGAEALRITLHKELTAENLEKMLLQLAERNLILKGGRARLSIYRDFGGFYAPSESSSSFVLQVKPLDKNFFELNHEGLSVDLYQEMPKIKNKLSGLKTLNGLHYIHAALFCREKNFDNCFLINEKSQILEAYNGNMFVVANGALYTPGLEMGVLAGVMRMHIINVAIKNGLKVYECGLMPQNLLASDEIFLTNAIQGITWVGSYRSKRYFNSIAKKLVVFLNEEVNQFVSSSSK
ncbi:MAG: aminotransferase class IV [Luteibaculaceae bacterium]